MSLVYDESPLKVYSSGRDMEKAYRERRFSIRQRLPTMTMQDLQRKKAAYDEDLEILQGRLKNIEAELEKVKAGASSFTLEEGGTVREVTVGPAEARKILEGLIGNVKTAMRWIRRERQIYVWEIRRRMLKAAKLPALKLQLSHSEAKARQLLSQIKECCRQLKQLCEDYNRTYNTIWSARQEVSLLSSEEAQITVLSLDPKVLNLIGEIDARLPSE